MKNLSKKAQRILEAIKSFEKPPRLYEIAEKTGISKQCALFKLITELSPFVERIETEEEKKYIYTKIKKQKTKRFQLKR